MSKQVIHNAENSHQPVDSGFTAGSGYFDSLGDRLSSRIENNDELEKVAPFLASLPLYQPFDVPAGYFEELPSIVMEKIPGQKPAISTWFTLILSPRVLLPIAATILLAILMIHSVTPDKPVQLAEQKIEEELFYIDESAIIEALEKTAVHTEEENTIGTYLIENGVDEAAISDETTEL